MTLIATGAARRRFNPHPEPDHPTSAPWNAATFTVTPTPDGTGSVVHPDVIDFWTQHGMRAWRGYRYWMAVTPYFNTNDDVENPCILVSHDAYTWQVPPGLTNPVYPWPGGALYNSDPDLTYDPDEDELVLIYRGGSLVPRLARSGDGVTWPASATQITYTHTGEILSPTLLRISATEWWLYGVQLSSGIVQRWTSTDLTTWTGPTNCTGLAAIAAWHIDVTHHSGVFWGLVNVYAQPGKLHSIASADGLSWSLGGEVIVPALLWESQWVYRATLTPHEAGDRFRVWYSARGTESWRVGYTQIPLTEWPAPPTP